MHRSTMIAIGRTASGPEPAPDRPATPGPARTNGPRASPPTAAVPVLPVGGSATTMPAGRIGRPDIVTARVARERGRPIGRPARSTP